jgi:2-polyprenyl-6-methoxyphenol hydroxylase-like FAD-dependent oxidoreductase
MFQVTDSLGIVLQVAVLVLGAGPTGLGTATRLQQHGFDDWLVVDKVLAHINSRGLMIVWLISMTCTCFRPIHSHTTA